MKKFFLIVSPYLFFCLIFSLIFILRTSKKSKEETKVELVDSIQYSIDSLSIIEDSIENHINSQKSKIEYINKSFDNLIIVGSFQLKNKADSVYNNLKSKGYRPFFVNVNSNYIRVCVETGNTLDEHNNLMISLRKDGYDPWILEKY